MRSARGGDPQCPATASSATLPGAASTIRYGPLPMNRVVPSASRCRARDTESRMRQDGQQRRVRLDQYELHRMRISTHALPSRRQGGHAAMSARRRALARLDPLEARRHLGGCHRTAVVETCAVTQGEGPGQTIPRHRPASREGRIHVCRAFAIGNEGRRRPAERSKGRHRRDWRPDRARPGCRRLRRAALCVSAPPRRTGARRKALEEAPNSSSRGARREPLEPIAIS